MSQTLFADPDALADRVSHLIDAGRFGVARPLLAAVKRLSVAGSRHAALTARLAMGEGRLDSAREVLDEAIALDPEDTALRRWRAELRMRLQDLQGAAEDAAEAVIGHPDDPIAKGLLGMTLLGLGQPADAVLCLREAVAGASRNPVFHQSLASAEQALGHADQALNVLLSGIAACPDDVAMRNAAVLHQIRAQAFQQALDLADQACRDGVLDACLLGLRGHALSSVGRDAEAAAAYAEARTLGPEDSYVRHLAATSGAVPGGDRAPDAYLRAVFDGYASTFETHILSLGYRVPGLLRAALLRHRPTLVPGSTDTPSPQPALDLGCGTGLVAVAASDLPLGPWVGIDLSSAMLREAAAKQLYAELVESDIVAALDADIRSYSVAFAADVLCYFGALAPVFAAVSRRLEAGGLFLLTVESVVAGENPDNGWSLGTKGRYRHTAAYVEHAAQYAGFTVVSIDPQTLRFDDERPVHGLVVVLRGAGP